MPRLSEQVLIPHGADDVFSIVRDIRRYPEFIRWVKRMRVSAEHEAGNLYTCVGEVDVSFKGFDEHFATRIVADRVKRTVKVDLVRGPFRHLRNKWQLDAREDNHTRVHFFIDYEFRNPVLGLLARTNTRYAVGQIMDAFQTEANKRFGGPAA